MATVYGKIGDKWAPLKCTDNGDGTYTLVVDTEISVDGATLNIDNLFVASTDGTVANAKYIKVLSDGTVIIEGLVGVRDSSDVRINPAKEDGNLATLAGKDFATSAKQDTIIGHIDGIESLLTSISGYTSKGNPKHYNGNANIASATVTFASNAKHVQAENMDTGSNNVYISFDSGSNWRTIAPGEIFDIDCDVVSSIDIKADADGTPYEIVTLE